MNATLTITLPVLAGAYKGKRKSLAITLTHAVIVGSADDVAVCGQPNMADEYSADDAEKAAAPTCKKCAAKLAHMSK